MNYFTNPTPEEMKNFLHTSTLDSQVYESVASIIREIKLNGDIGLKTCTLRYDKVDLANRSIAIGQKEMLKALEELEPELKNALMVAKDNIVNYHSRQLRESWKMDIGKDSYIRERTIALKRAGVYVPGGTAPLVSSVLMSVLPAHVAGVKEIYVVTPPAKDGTVNQGILAACALCDVKAIYTVGGAQAIAALAYGTETVPQVDIIAGPGNQYVTEAKRQLYGIVNIDMVAGPSEVLVLADDSSNPQWVALDLLSQLEHGTDSKAICISPSQNFLDALKKAVAEESTKLNRSDILSISIKEGLALIEVDSLYDMVELTNVIAPEHLEIVIKNPDAILDQIRNAGVIFLGEYTPESVGDYIAGPSHVLPTGGKARFFSGLSVYHFIRKMSIISYSQEKLLSDLPYIKTLATCEGLDAHCASALMRKEQK